MGKDGDAPTHRKARVCFFDIESTNLVADFGTLLCTSWKWAGENAVHTAAITDYKTFKKTPWDDKRLVRDVSAALSQADVWVTWYGQRFDVPFLNARLLSHGLPPMPPIPHVDAWRISRYQLKLSSNRLKNVSEFFELGERKTPLSGPIWVKARAGHGPSIKYVIEHCEADVRVLEEAYDQIKCLCPKHPNVNLTDKTMEGCPKCGGKVQRRGTQIAQSRSYQRYQCQKCGGWCRARVADKREVHVSVI